MVIPVLNTIEYSDVSVNDINNNLELSKWISMDQTLPAEISGHRAYVYGSDIIVIGGQDWENGNLEENYQVFVIDTIQQTVSTDGILDFYALYEAAIFVWPFFYALGGTGNQQSYNYHYYHLKYEEINPETRPINIFPIYGRNITKTINIRSIIQNTINDTNYYCKFNIIIKIVSSNHFFIFSRYGDLIMIQLINF